MLFQSENILLDILFLEDVIKISPGHINWLLGMYFNSVAAFRKGGELFTRYRLFQMDQYKFIS
jgi:hypothetical protein